MFLSLLLPVSGSARRKESEGKEGKQRFEEKSDGEIRSFSFSQQSGPIFKRSFSVVFFRACALLMDNILNGSAGSAAFTTFFRDDGNWRYLRYII